MSKQLGKFRDQSTPRKILNILGIGIVFIVGLEVLLRFFGFMVSLQILHVDNLWRKTERTEQVILCIGDSWTVGEPDGNYPADLQQALNQQASANRFRVINLGHGGANSSQALRILAGAIPTYHPRLVIVMIGNNDHWNLSDSAYWRFIERDMSRFGLLKARITVILHSLRVYKLITILYDKLVGLPTPNQFYDEKAGTQGFEKTTVIDRAVHRKQLEYNLLQFIELAQQYNFHVVFQTYFHFHGYQVNEIVRDVALSYHIPLVDNNLLFHQHIPADQHDEYLIPDGHPNAKGYQFLTNNLLDVLREQGWVGLTGKK